MHTKEVKFNKIIFVVIFILAVALDRITKILAVQQLSGGETVDVIGSVFQFVYTENQGAAFGILQGKQVLFYIITFAVVILILYFLIRLPAEKRYFPIGLVATLILSGALGNLYDRLTQQYVVDFIYFSPIDFPVFNVADIFVTLGCIAFAILVLFVYRDNDFNFLDPRKRKNAVES